MCVLALAAVDHLDASDVNVGPDTMTIYDGKHAGVYAMSDRARRYISKFDHQGRKAIRPQTFILEKIS